MNRVLEINISKAIADVRRSGVTNMYDKKRVLQEIWENCDNDEVRTFIKEHELDYLYLF